MRWGVRRAAVMLAVLLLAGCAQLPAGADGKLVDDWAALPDPTLPPVAVGQCFPEGTSGENRDFGWIRPRPCTELHTYEVIYVGTVTGADAQRQTPPPPGSVTEQDAYRECTAKARDVLGGDWRTAYLHLYVVFPNVQHWQAGARWFSCDVAETFKEGDWQARRTSRSSTLRGALVNEPELRLSCFMIDPRDGGSSTLLPFPCEYPHPVEFVAVVEAPAGPYPETSADRRAAFVSLCLSAIAKYAGVPDDGKLTYRTGWWLSHQDRDAWEQGDRSARCFYYDDKPRTGSIKGVGPKGLPVN